MEILNNNTANPETLATFCVIGTLRDALKYRSREAMTRNWQNVFPGEMLPDDHMTVEPDRVLKFVNEIAIPQRGRPGGITSAAQTLLKTINRKKNVADVSKNIAEPVADVPENIVNDSANFSETTTSAQSAQPDVFDNMANKFWSWLMSLTKLDVVYLFTLGVADYGLVFILKEMGIVAAVVYTLVSLHALDMAKNRRSQVTAQNGIVAVWLLEVCSFAVHLSMFNRRLWASISELPFQIDDIETESRPYYIAVVLAVLLSAAGIYAVSTTLSLLRESIEADNFEHDHGRKY